MTATTPEHPYQEGVLLSLYELCVKTGRDVADGSTSPAKLKQIETKTREALRQFET